MLQFKHISRVVRNYIAVLIVLLLVSDETHGQLHGKILEKETTRKEQDKNILWEKIVIRKITLSEIPNSPLSHLKDSAGGETNINLMIAKGVRNGNIYAYPSINKKTANNVSDSFMRRVADYYLAIDFTKVNNYLILESWEFHKDRGEMIVRILWMGPVDTGAMPKELNLKNIEDIECFDKEIRAMFWMKYDELATELKKFVLIDPVEISCFDFFETRRFASRIICVSNPDGTTSSKERDTEGLWIY